MPEIATNPHIASRASSELPFQCLFVFFVQKMQAEEVEKLQNELKQNLDLYRQQLAGFDGVNLDELDAPSKQVWPGMFKITAKSNGVQ